MEINIQRNEHGLFASVPHLPEIMVMGQSEVEVIQRAGEIFIEYLKFVADDGGMIDLSQHEDLKPFFSKALEIQGHENVPWFSVLLSNEDITPEDIERTKQVIESSDEGSVG